MQTGNQTIHTAQPKSTAKKDAVQYAITMPPSTFQHHQTFPPNSHQPSSQRTNHRPTLRYAKGAGRERAAKEAETGARTRRSPEKVEESRRSCQNSLPQHRAVCAGWWACHLHRPAACGVCKKSHISIPIPIPVFHIRGATHLKVNPTNKLRPISPSLSTILSNASCLSNTSLYLAISFSLPKSSK